MGNLFFKRIAALPLGKNGISGLSIIFLEEVLHMLQVFIVRIYFLTHNIFQTIFPKSLYPMIYYWPSVTAMIPFHVPDASIISLSSCRYPHVIIAQKQVDIMDSAFSHLIFTPMTSLIYEKSTLLFL